VLPDGLGVERVLAVDALGRVAVGDHQLGDREAVRDLPHLLAVTEAHLVQDQPLALVDSHTQGPTLPVDTPPVDLEGRPVVLVDHQLVEVDVGTGLVLAGAGVTTRDLAVLLHRTTVAVSRTHRAQPADRCA
jgi:hypothetical protein